MSDELAKEIAEALTPPAKKPSAKMAKSTAAYIYSKRAAERSAEISRIREIVLPILRPHIERHERLREADEMLRECRAIVQDRKGAWEIVDKTFHQNETKRQGGVSKCTDLLARIDAVLKGGA